MPWRAGRSGGHIAGALPGARRAAHAPASGQRIRTPKLAQAGLLRLRQDAGPTVGRFHRHGWRIGLLTDSTCETETLWPGLEISRLFDTAVFSCAEGRSKPDRLLFETVVERLGVAPERCVYVADGRSGELPAAAAFGMRPIQLDVGQTGAEEWYGVRVPDLTTVADLVLEADGFPSS